MLNSLLILKKQKQRLFCRLTRESSGSRERFPAQVREQDRPWSVPSFRALAVPAGGVTNDRSRGNERNPAVRLCRHLPLRSPPAPRLLGLADRDRHRAGRDFPARRRGRREALTRGRGPAGEGGGGGRDVSRGGGRRCPHGRGGRQQECAPGQRPPRRYEAGWRHRALLVQVRLEPLPLPGKALRCWRRSPGFPACPHPGARPAPALPASSVPAAPGKDAAPGWRGSDGRTAPGEAISEEFGAPRRTGTLLSLLLPSGRDTVPPPRTVPAVSLLRTAAETVEGRGKIGNYCEKQGKKNPNY